jgi:hypothetical protein
LVDRTVLPAMAWSVQPENKNAYRISIDYKHLAAESAVMVEFE